MAHEDRVAVEACWTGVAAVTVGSLAARSEMKASFAMFFRFREGRIAMHCNYDCFDNTINRDRPVLEDQCNGSCLLDLYLALEPCNVQLNPICWRHRTDTGEVVLGAPGCFTVPHSTRQDATPSPEKPGT